MDKEKLDNELAALAAKPDSEIDLSDIPEVTDWSGAVVGKFYRPRKLFVSFTALLRHMREGDVTFSDLDRGLFYFGCTREHAFCPGAQAESNELDWIFGSDLERAKTIHRAILYYLEQAEADGRCVWRRASDMNSYEVLNNLLVANGYSYNRKGGPAIIVEPRTEAEKYDYLKGNQKAICFEADDRTENPWYAYCYPGVRDRIQEAAIPLEVVL